MSEIRHCLFFISIPSPSFIKVVFHHLFEKSGELLHWDKATADSGVGDPRKATAEKGERYVKPIVEKLARLFEEMVKHDLYE